MYLSFKDKYRLKVKGWKMILQANIIQRKVGVSVLIPDKIDLKIKNATRNKEGHFIIIKGQYIRKIHTCTQSGNIKI